MVTLKWDNVSSLCNTVKSMPEKRQHFKHFTDCLMTEEGGEEVK